MKLYELLSICNNSENTIIVKKGKGKRKRNPFKDRHRDR